MDIVTRVADERDALLVARQVAPTNAEEQFDRIVLIEEIGRADWAGAVERLEIGAGCPGVAQGIDVALHAQRRAVGRQVVCEVLAEEGLASLDVALRVACPAVADAAFASKGEQPIVVETSGGWVGKQASITAALRERSIDRAAGGQAQVSCCAGQARPCGGLRHVGLIPANAANLKSDLGLRCSGLPGDVLQANLTVRDEPTRLVGDIDTPQLLGAALVEGGRFDEDPPGRK